MNTPEMKVLLEWCQEKGQTEREILALLLRIVNAKPEAPSQNE